MILNHSTLRLGLPLWLWGSVALAQPFAPVEPSAPAEANPTPASPAAAAAAPMAPPPAPAAPAPTAVPAPAPQPVAVQPVAAVAPAVGPAPATTPADAPALPEMERAKLPGFAVVPRVGLVVVGSGTDRVRCDGNDCTAALDNDLGYSQLPGFAVGVDLFGQLSPLWRLGGGLLVSPVSKADPDESSADMELGTLASALFIAELTPQVGRRSWLTPRVQLGPSLLFTSGELDDALEEAKAQCEAVQTVDGCNSIDRTHLGFTLGVGFGGMFGVSEHVRLRVEGLVDFHAFRIMQLSSNVGDAEVSETLMQNRFLLLAGVEL